MSLLKTISVCVSLVVISTAALAFQEQQGGSAPPPAPAATPADQQGAPAQLNTSTDGLKPSIGTEVRVPGLGKLGNLPKMDFGLELLYGAAEQKQQLDAQPRESERDDLTIRGSVKHKF
jgi:hypothetical protein